MKGILRLRALIRARSAQDDRTVAAFRTLCTQDDRRVAVFREYFACGDRNVTARRAVKLGMGSCKERTDGALSVVVIPENPEGGQSAIAEFFRLYEQSIQDSDAELVSKLYADTFLFASPQGVQAVKKEDFLKVLPRRKEFMKAAGLVSSQVESVEASKLDSKYTLARTLWKMRVRTEDGGEAAREISASYVLSVVGESFEIVFQVDHQDLAKTLQEVRGTITKVIPDAQNH